MNEGALPELPRGWVWTRLKEIKRHGNYAESGLVV